MKCLMYPKVIAKKKPRKGLHRVRQTAYKTLKDKAWKAFSHWVRTHDCPTVGKDWNTCYTCGKDFLIGAMNAGHFKHGHSKKTFFDERNVKPQCVHCNHWLHGNLGLYAAHLIKDYGGGIVEELEVLSKPAYKWSREELEGIVRKYGGDK